MNKLPDKYKEILSKIKKGNIYGALFKNSRNESGQ